MVVVMKSGSGSTPVMLVMKMARGGPRRELPKTESWTPGFGDFLDMVNGHEAQAAQESCAKNGFCASSRLTVLTQNCSGVAGPIGNSRG